MLFVGGRYYTDPMKDTDLSADGERFFATVVKSALQTPAQEFFGTRSPLLFVQTFSSNGDTLPSSQSTLMQQIDQIG